jgi:hypothetical protein
MKQFWFHKDVFVWSMILIAAVLVPRLALSAEPCESEASSVLKKKSVEIEIAVITGELSELEIPGKKEALLRLVNRQKASCRRSLSARAPSARAEASSF